MEVSAVPLLVILVSRTRSLERHQIMFTFTIIILRVPFLPNTVDYSSEQVLNGNKKLKQDNEET